MVDAWFEKFDLSFQIDRQTMDKFSVDTLSPLTNFSLSILKELVNYNVIITTPTGWLRPISLLAYIVACETNRSVLVFSKSSSRSEESPFTHHCEAYQSLMNNGEYILFQIPMASLKDEALFVDLKKIFPYASHKHSYATRLREQFLARYFNSERAKVIFLPFDSDSKIQRAFQSHIIESEETQELNQLLKLDIGTIIFENMDYFIYSNGKMNTFLTWIEAIRDPSIKLLLHFSNPDSKFILPVKERLDALLLHYSKSLFRANEFLNGKSKKYFTSMDSKNSIAKTFNIDEPYLYEGNIPIKIEKTLPRGNMDEYFSEAMDIFDQIDSTLIESGFRHAYFKLRSLFYNLYKLVINPGFFKLRYYCTGNEEWTVNTISSFISDVSSMISNAKDSSSITGFHYLLSILSSMVGELKDCKLYEETSSEFTRESKSFCVMEYITLNIDDKFAIAVDDYEQELLRNEIIHCIPEERINDIHITTLGRLQSARWDVSDWALVLPGQVLPKYFSVFFMPWKRIIFFAYEGSDQMHIQRQIDLVTNVSLGEEAISIRFFKEIETNLNRPGSGIVKDFERRKTLVPEAMASSTILANDHGSLTELLKSLVNTDPLLKDYKEHQEIEQELDKETNQIEQDLYDQAFENQDYYQMELYDEKSSTTIIKRLRVDKEYFYFDDETQELKSGFPYVLKEGQRIIFIDQDERISIVQLVTEIGNLDDQVNWRLIEGWTQHLAAYYEKNFTTAKEFHDIYKKYVNECCNGREARTYPTFLTWIRGEVNYTRSPEDVECLGKIMNDPFLIENYSAIHEQGQRLQDAHRKLSASLGKIIRQELHDDIEVDKLSLSERELYSRVHESIFTIINIQKIIAEETSIPE